MGPHGRAAASDDEEVRPLRRTASLADLISSPISSPASAEAAAADLAAAQAAAAAGGDRARGRQVPSEADDAHQERKATGRSAEPSGRGAKVEFLDEATSHARLCPGEALDCAPWADAAGGKACMVEHPPGSGVYFQGFARKLTRTEVLFSIPREPPEQSLHRWVSLRSGRIWRGSMHAKAWSHVGRGAWKPKRAALPKPRAPGGRRPGRRKRGSVDALEGDEATTTTRATGQDSEAEEDAGDSLSPRPVRGSNAVTPDAPEPAAAAAGGGPAGCKRGSPAAAAARVKPEPGLPVERPAPHAAAAAAAAAPCSGGLEGWYARHFELLRAAGRLNRSPDGCNPESGRLPALACAGSTVTGQTRPKQAAASSSSEGSAAKGPSAASGKERAQHRSKGGKAERDSSGSETRAPKRDSSPPTPRKRADDCRAAAGRQRSSSADGERPAKRRPSGPAPGKSKPVPGTSPGPKGGAAGQAAGQAPRNGEHRSQLSAPGGKPRPIEQAARKAGPAHAAGGGTAGKQQQLPVQLQPPPRKQWSSPPERLHAFAALVETDPFAVPQPKKQRLA